MRNVRVAALTEASRHTHRDSPFAAVDNAHPLVLRIDGDTGQVLAEGKKSPIEIQIRYQLRPDENRLVLDPETVRGLQESLKQLKTGNEFLKAIVEALLDLPKTPIVLPRSARPALEAKAVGAEALVLPPPDAAVLKSNRAALRTNDTHNIAMTVMMGSESAAIKHWYKVGTLSLDAEGRIVGTAMGRPDFQSPRGTQYRKGVNLGGDEVAAILFGDTVMWHGPLGDLNPKQQSAVLALFDAGATKRGPLLLEDPYAVDAILGEGLGKMAMDISGLVYDMRGYRASLEKNEALNLSLKVIRDGEGLLRVVSAGDGAMIPFHAGTHRRSNDAGESLGKIEVRFQHSKDGAVPKVSGNLLPVLKSFEFSVEPGMEQGQQIADLLGFLQKSWTIQDGN